MQENECDKLTIGFGFKSDWSRKWCELFQPIREWSKAKPKQTQHFFQHSIENCAMYSMFCYPYFEMCPPSKKSKMLLGKYDSLFARIRNISRGIKIPPFKGSSRMSSFAQFWQPPPPSTNKEELMARNFEHSI